MKTDTIEQAVEILSSMYGLTAEITDGMKSGVIGLCHFRYLEWQNTDQRKQDERFVTHIAISRRYFKIGIKFNFLTGDTTLYVEELTWDNFNLSVQFSLNLNLFVTERISERRAN